MFTGLSGSGKSSLAFDTIYAEGQRRYVESLSAYARQFLGQMEKPDVDFIEGLSPAISIDQKTASPQPALDGRHDHRDLRLPAAALRRGSAIAALPRDCGAVITRQTPAADRRPRARSSPRAPASRCSRPSCGAARASTTALFDGARRRRASRGPGSTARSSTRRADAVDGSARYEKHTIEVVVDRLVRRDGIERRLTDSVETALRSPRASPRSRSCPRRRRRAERETLTFSEHLACPHCGLLFDELAPRNFSFNSPYGACERCDGLGTRFEVDPELVVPDDDLVARRRRDRAVVGPAASTSTACSTPSAARRLHRLDTPWKKLEEAARRHPLRHRRTKRSRCRYKQPLRAQRSYTTRFEGVIP